jgi:cobalt transporter subunit CbtB
MSQASSVIQPLKKVSVHSKNVQIAMSALLGVVILMVVGFAPVEVIHNATHDTRHSTGFPCH